MLASVVQLVGYQPSILTLASGLWHGMELNVLLQFELVFRFATRVGALAHENAHLVAAALICGTWRGILTLENCLGNITLYSHMLQLLPCMPCSHATYVTLPSCTKKGSACAVHLVGLAASAMFVLLSGVDWSSPIACAALFNLVMAVFSDFLVFWKKDWALCPGIFGCGNWGLVIASNQLKDGGGGNLFPTEAMQLLQRVLGVVELRGAQAGGLCLFAQGNGTVPVIARVVKKKRAQLPQAILSKLWWQCKTLQVRSLWRYKQPEVILAQGHSRFGTSSAPALRETHPHQWVGTTLEKRWSFNIFKSQWECSTIPFCVTITHNGDFDEWKPYEEFIGVRELGQWLQRVLHKKNTARGDSAKLAGVMDLLITKGSWFRSVRFAYALLVLTHCEQITGWEELSSDAPNTMPTQDILQSWAAAFDQVFKSYIDYHSPDKSYVAQSVWDPEVGMTDDVQTGVIIEDLASMAVLKVESCMSEKSRDAMKAVMHDEGLRSAFINGAVRAFLQQDLLTATWQFFRRARGTFGVSVSCTAFPSNCVLAARGQPMSVGFDSSRALALWASEPASLAATWSAGPALRPAANSRWDLHDATGEILEIQVLPPKMTCEQANRLLVFPAVQASYFEVPSPQQNNVDDTQSTPAGSAEKYSLVLRGCSMAATPVEIDLETFEDRLVNLGFAGIDSPLGESMVSSSSSLASRLSQWTLSRTPDNVALDLASIPRVLQSIDSVWQDPMSMNRESADLFAQCLLERVEAIKSGRQRSVSDIDLLVTGVEGSHWIGQQFVADISRLFPALHACALSSNYVLGLLQGGAGRVEPLNFPVNTDNFKLADGAVCLALSQSGTTYPTVWAARLLSNDPRCKVFAMSGHFDTVLAASVGQNLAEKVFHRKLFSTGAGIRPAEPSTVASVAMHHTLSHLLEVCLKATAGSWHLQQGGRRIKPEDVTDYQKMLLSLKVSAEQLCGYDVLGQKTQSNTHSGLMQMGDNWAGHLTEGYWATVWGALYIYVSVTLGVPIISTIWDAVGLKFVWIPRFLDANIYVFLAAIICLGHRILTGRRLRTRFCSRTVVVVDANTMVYKLLRAYVSKLRALAFRFTTFSVLGQNGTDHFVHEMTHLTTSDVLVAVGRPDGRLAALAASEASMIMSLQQAKFIKKGSSGIEAFSLGHNPWTNSCLFTRHISLPTKGRPAFLSQTHLSKRGDGNIVDISAPCAPEEVVSRLIALYKGRKMGGHSLERPQIDFEILKSLAHGRTHLTRAEIREWIVSIVEEQARDLAIDVQDFRVTKVVKNDDDGNPQAENTTGIAATRDTGLYAEEVSDAASSASNSSDECEDTDTGPKTGLKTHKRMPEFVRGRSCYMEATKTKDNEKLALAEVMAIVRGPTIKMEIQRAKKAKRRKMAQSLAESGGLISGLAFQSVSLEEAFHGWRAVTSEAVTASQVTTGSIQAGDWRQKEALRKSKSSQSALSMAFQGPLSLPEIFNAWKSLASSRQANMQAHAIGACWEHRAAPLNHVLEMQRLMENLYETRIGCTERLIGFLVVFHRMVTPISKVPFLGFSMDRTESRLRVASTPAPVPMRSELQVVKTSGKIIQESKPKTEAQCPSELQSGEGRMVSDAQEVEYIHF